MYGQQSLKLEVSSNLSIKTILERTSEEDLIQHYAGISDIRDGQTYISPFRNETRPSFSAKHYGGKWRFRDWTDGWKGDVFDLIQRVEGCNIQEALIKIDSWLTGNPSLITKAPRIKQVKERVLDFAPVFRPIDKQDLKFFSQFFIDRAILTKFNVRALKAVHMRHDQDPFKPVYVFVKSNIGYCYTFPVGYSNKYKFYFPHNKGMRFLGNVPGDRIQGWDQLPSSGSEVIITKSLKDVMAFYAFGIPAIAPQGEGMLIDHNSIIELQARFERVITIFDWDRAGRHGAYAHKQTYGIPYLKLERAKDFSDVCKLYSNKTRHELEKLIEKTRTEIVIKYF